MNGLPNMVIGNTTLHRLLRLEVLGQRRALAAKEAQHVDGALYVGPVLAEFGHELFLAAQMRCAARNYTAAIVCSRPGREALYADFCTKFIPHDIVCESSYLAPVPTGSVSEEAKGRYAAPPGTIPFAQVPYLPPYQVKPVEFVVYGQPDPDFIGVVAVHARARPYISPRNWPVAAWVEALSALAPIFKGARVVSIGSPDAAAHVPGTEDMRGLPLDRQMDLLRSAQLAIGPSSGPMHLASLCKCPHVVWCGGPRPEREETMSRYRKHWNPHGTPCLAMPWGNWRPPVARVVAWVTHFLKCRAIGTTPVANDSAGDA